MLNSSNNYQTKVIPYNFEEMFPTRLEWIPSLKKTCRVPDYTRQKPVTLTNDIVNIDLTKLGRR